MKTKTTLKDVLSGFEHKRRSGVDWDNPNIVFVRWPSLLLTPVCMNIGLSANTVTVISCLIGMMSIICLGTCDKSIQVIGWAGLFIAHLFDCVDGNIARTTRSSSHYGKFIDGVADSLYAPLLFVALGISLMSGYSGSGILSANSVSWMLVGAAGSYFRIMTLYLNFRYRAACFEVNIQRLNNAAQKKTGSEVTNDRDKRDERPFVTTPSKERILFSMCLDRFLVFWRKVFRGLRELERPLLIFALFYHLKAYLLFYTSVYAFNMLVQLFRYVRDGRYSLKLHRAL